MEATSAGVTGDIVGENEVSMEPGKLVEIP
jgi:hypothetical protein